MGGEVLNFLGRGKGDVGDHEGTHGVMFDGEGNPTGGLFSLRTEGVEADEVEARRGKLVHGVRHAGEYACLQT